MTRNESVWDYPRPPAMDHSPEHVQVLWHGHELVNTTRSVRVLETSHPPTYYFHPDDVNMSILEEATGATFCEWKGRARYFDIVDGTDRISKAVWSYPEPTRAFMDIAGWFSLYPSSVDRCLVDGEEITPQKGHYYGGWITPGIRGPFKGGAGTHGW
ncbi:MAG: DUF427 domain-containing protein [Spirochaetota bacterium]